mmetsp:Transcript_37535/g.82199  ORF Transcript_37535/g.82199 Transcript_37535/m.82199 type:complete len:827 (+) Transcript_37535:177-2657(+)
MKLYAKATAAVAALLGGAAQVVAGYSDSSRSSKSCRVGDADQYPGDIQSVLYSKDGKLEVSLHIAVTDFESTMADGGGFESNVVGYYGCYANGQVRCAGSAPAKHMGGPTLRVKPGDELIIHLFNDLPKEKCKTKDDIAWWNQFHAITNTNLHVHGLFVPNTENDVLTPVEPEMSHTYTVNIREVQQGGTHWYHPHSEGSVGLQAGGGALGLLIIDDLEHDLPHEVASLPEVNMRIQYTDFTYLSGCPTANQVWDTSTASSLESFKRCNTDEILNANHPLGEAFTYAVFNYAENFVRDTCQNICKADAGVSDDYPGTVDCGCDAETECEEPIFGVMEKSGTYSQSLTVNGVEKPKIEMVAGQWYRFRTLFVPTYKKSIEPIIRGCDFKLLAKDGRYIPVAPRDISAEGGYMFSGSRADFLVRCNDPGEFSFESINEVPLATDWATYNSTTGQNTINNPLGDAFVASQKWSAWTGTMATLNVVERCREEDIEVDVIPDFIPARPCYLPDLRNVEKDSPYVILQSGMAPPNDWTTTGDGESYPFFRRVTPPWPQPPLSVPEALVEYYGINDITEADTAFPGQLSPPKGDCVANTCNSFDEYYGRPPKGQDFSLDIGDIVEIDYFAPQIHPIHFHVFGFQITQLPEFDVKKEFFKVGDYHDTLIVPIDGTNPNGSLTEPQYGKAVLKQHIYSLETEVVVHCHFYRHSDRGMVQLGDTVGTPGSSSCKVEGTCYHGLHGREFTYCHDDPEYCASFGHDGGRRLAPKTSHVRRGLAQTGGWSQSKSHSGGSRGKNTARSHSGGSKGKATGGSKSKSGSNQCKNGQQTFIPH